MGTNKTLTTAITTKKRYLEAWICLFVGIGKGFFFYLQFMNEDEVSYVQCVNFKSLERTLLQKKLKTK